VYNEEVALNTGSYNFTPSAKIKSKDLLLQPKILHRIIAHNILSKKGHYNKVTFKDICLIDCMIRGYQINLSFIMMKNMIMAYDKKQKNKNKNKSLFHMVKSWSLYLKALTLVSNTNRSIVSSSGSALDDHALLGANYNQAQAPSLDASSSSAMSPCREGVPSEHDVLESTLLSGSLAIAYKFVFLSCMIKK